MGHQNIYLPALTPGDSVIPSRARQCLGVTKFDSRYSQESNTRPSVPLSASSSGGPVFEINGGAHVRRARPSLNRRVSTRLLEIGLYVGGNIIVPMIGGLILQEGG